MKHPDTGHLVFLSRIVLCSGAVTDDDVRFAVTG